jgi:hypothetical protein
LAKNSYFSHGPYHYLKVPCGQNEKVWAKEMSMKALVPRLIKEGEHFTWLTLFKYVGMVKVSDEYIGHNSIHILNVVKGRISKANCDNLPRLFSKSLHIVKSSNFFYKGMQDITSENLCISHGTITILQVPRGKLRCFGTRTSHFLLDSPDLYKWNDINVHFVEVADASMWFIKLGSKKIIQVYTGEVGITYDKGELMILKNDRHVIDSSKHFLAVLVYETAKYPPRHLQCQP